MRFLSSSTSWEHGVLFTSLTSLSSDAQHFNRAFIAIGLWAAKTSFINKKGPDNQVHPKYRGLNIVRGQKAPKIVRLQPIIAVPVAQDPNKASLQIAGRMP
jgi:hypothetical protein